MLFVSCSGSDELSGVDTRPPEMKTWNVLLNSAEKDTIAGVDDVTRALFIGGYTDRYGSLWDKGDVVHVYQGGVRVAGQLEPDAASYGTKLATLTGTLTGSFAKDETLRLYQPSLAMDYTGQTGTIQSASAKTYQYGDVTVETAQNNTLTLSNVNLNYLMNYIRFRLTDVDTHERLRPSQLILHAVSGGEAVLTKDEAGNVTTGDVVVNLTKENYEYPSDIYVSLLNKDNARVTYQLKATMENGDVYVGPLDGTADGFGSYSPNLSTKGTLRECSRFLKKMTSGSSLTIVDVDNQTFTGYEIKPTLTVKDGETTLTLDKDYSVAYADNVNVGEATATITGLADQKATAETKYMGTQSKTFNIVQATPVIEMSTAAMTLVNNATQNSKTRAVTRVFVDNNANGTFDEGDYDITDLCTVTYASADDAVATVDATTGAVTAHGFGTTTVTATVAAATNWTVQTATYTVNVEQEVSGSNAVNPWDNGGSGGGKIFVE